MQQLGDQARQCLYVDLISADECVDDLLKRTHIRRKLVWVVSGEIGPSEQAKSRYSYE